MSSVEDYNKYRRIHVAGTRKVGKPKELSITNN